MPGRSIRAKVRLSARYWPTQEEVLEVMSPAIVATCRSVLNQPSPVRSFGDNFVKAPTPQLGLPVVVVEKYKPRRMRKLPSPRIQREQPREQPAPAPLVVSPPHPETRRVFEPMFRPANAVLTECGCMLLAWMPEDRIGRSVCGACFQLIKRYVQPGDVRAS